METITKKVTKAALYFPSFPSSLRKNSHFCSDNVEDGAGRSLFLVYKLERVSQGKSCKHREDSIILDFLR